MALTAGTRIGSYEITGALGQGGMGEVYRARDTRLGRDVAIKALPDLVANDAERIARFEREAHVLATLNHAHIAAIYGLEEADSARFLVLEFVEGQSLADRIAAGPLPLAEAVGIARQILEALEAAHDKNIIHRDLKPANVMLTVDGQVKVLDFGLARVVESDPTASVSNSPTLTFAATQIGVVLGTAAYMAPEQAKGRVADKRCDVWAFGCVFYEMLTGKRVFDGEDVSDTLAFVLTREPDWSALPAGVPPRLRDLLKRCLERDRKARIPDVSAVRYLLDDALTAPTSAAAVAPAVAAPRRALWKRVLPVALASIAAAVITGAAAWYLRAVPSTPTVRFVISIPENQLLTGTGRHIVAISPDGTNLVYVASARLFNRPLAGTVAHFIPGTEGFQNVTDPVFSPDGAWIAFWATSDGTIKRVPAAGGAPVTVCRADNPFGMNWSDEGLLIGQGPKGILLVPSDGSGPRVVVSVKDGELAHGPQFLPGGDNILFTLGRGTAGDRWDKAQVVVQSLKTGDHKVIIASGSDARYLPTGHLAYALGGVLFAVPFDAKRLEVKGGAVPIVEGVRRAALPASNSAAAFYAFSDTGTLMYVPGAAVLNSAQDLVLADRKGGATPLKLPGGSYVAPRVSPDGKRVAVGTEDEKEAVVWVYDLSGTSAIQKLTFSGRNRFPAWSADSKRVAFQSDRGGDLGIFWQPADGTGSAERLTKAGSGESHAPESFSPRGDRLLFSVTKGSEISLWSVNLADKRTAPFADVRSTFLPNAVYSPDGRWVAYVGNDQSGSTIFVQPDPPTGAKYQLFARGGPGPHDPTWSHDGTELFYNPRPGAFEVVSVTTQPTFAFGNPVDVPRQFILGGAQLSRNFDITPDGRFVGVMSADSAAGTSAPANTQIQVMLNWFEDVKTRAK